MRATVSALLYPPARHLLGIRALSIWDSGTMFRVLGFGFQNSVFWISGFGFQDWGSGIRDLGFGF